MSEQATESALDRAVAYLGAVEVAPGRYAWYGTHPLNTWDPTPRWYTFHVSSRMLRAFEHADYDYEKKAFRTMVADGFVAMPAWWTPEHREAYRVAQPGTTPFYVYGFGTEAYADPTSKGYKPDSITKVIADLETGEEVVA